MEIGGVWVVGGGEVGVGAGEMDVGSLVDEVEEGVGLVGGDAETTHARVNFEMDGSGLLEALGCSGDGL